MMMPVSVRPNATTIRTNGTNSTASPHFVIEIVIGSPRFQAASTFA